MVKPSTDYAADLLNKQMFLRQSCSDPSFPNKLLVTYLENLKYDLNLKSTRDEHARFFTGLVTEWLSSSNRPESRIDDLCQIRDVSEIESDVRDSTFEATERSKMHEQMAIWESIIFSKPNVDEEGIMAYL